MFIPLVALLALITIAATIAQLIAFKRMWAYVHEELKFVPSTFVPKVSVILPCKGLDPGFKDNISKLLSQDYPNFEVIFAVADERDPAYPAIKETIAARKNDLPYCQCVVAGVNPKRGQKINNQLTALKSVANDCEVLVFVDSDVIARPDFIRYLVAHLENKEVGATTGYRFYIPFKGDWPSLIRSLWNRMSAWELASPTYSFAWGGAMAIRKSTFDRARVAGHWDTACDDDLSLTTAVKALGLTVKFVPQCLVASDGDATLAEIVEWMNRQLILTKVYYPQLWRRAIRRAFLLTFWLLAVLGSFFFGVFSGNRELFLAASAGLTLIPVELWFLFKAQALWQSVLPGGSQPHAHLNPTPGNQERQDSIQRAFRKSLWRFSLVLPLAHLVLPWMTLYSLLTNRIKWRGITYELKSPTETVVV